MWNARLDVDLHLDLHWQSLPHLNLVDDLVQFIRVGVDDRGVVFVESLVETESDFVKILEKCFSVVVGEGVVQLEGIFLILAAEMTEIPDLEVLVCDLGC